MASDMIRLYELVMANGRPASPYVWRIRYALAHKGIACESVPIGFTDIPGLFGGKFRTVPIIEHQDLVLAESWDIAEYLDRAFPHHLLFSSPAEQSMVRFAETWSTDVLRKMFSIYALDIHDAARPEDREYFRRSRQQWLKGVTLEEFTAGREGRLPALRESLAPLRAHLKHHSFIGGTAPNYGDYIILGLFLWVASVLTLAPLARDDSLRDWIDRCLDLYGGLGRDARMKSLFD